MEGYRFKVGDQAVFNEERVTIQKLTSINGWPAYFVNEFSYAIADVDLIEPAKIPAYDETQN